MRLASPRDARQMKIAATSMLVVMAFIYLGAHQFVEVHPAVGFVKAFAEAAMVGGLADWFAVTALFRHPLGLPIPHTAIIPRNKDRIGDTLAQFLKDNFLIPAVVARRMRNLDIAGAAGRFLAERESGGAGRLREGASRMLADLLESLDDQRLGSMVKSSVADRLKRLEVAPLLGQALEAAMREGRHEPLLDGVIIRVANVIETNDAIIREMVHERAGRILRWTGLDENVSDAIINGLNKLMSDMAEDPAHPLRGRANEMLAELAVNLQYKPQMRERVENLKAEIITNPAMQAWIAGLWDQAREALLRAARDPERAMAGRMGDALRQLGSTLQNEGELRDTINRFARRAAVGASANYGDSIVKLVSETVRTWDVQKITDRIEGAVGRDLQYIRINGTLVGGLVGLLIHAVDVLI